MKLLSTEHLLLRPLMLSDLDAFYQYARKPHIGPSAGWKPHASLDESLSILKMMIQEEEVWGITLKHNPLLIGTIGLHVRNLDNALLNQKEIGYVLDDTYWGKGFMVEAVKEVLRHAFVDLELDCVLCGHAITNTQSKRVIEKTGFRFTHIEQRDHFDKTKIDIMMYHLTKEDYLNGHTQTEI